MAGGTQNRSISEEEAARFSTTGSGARRPPTARKLPVLRARPRCAGALDSAVALPTLPGVSKARSTA